MVSALRPRPAISIITPTYGREDFIMGVFDCLRAQSYQDFEWLVLDDSENPSAALFACQWDKLTYQHSPQRLSVGEKRNRLVDMARGDVIIHFDDDDYYGPDYVSKTLLRLTENAHDVLMLSGFFVAHLNAENVGYCRTQVKKGAGFRLTALA